jgi:DNA-binding NtrC family response regulator
MSFTKILIIDDDPGFLSIASRYITKFGYIPILSSNVSSGLKILKEEVNNIGLIITDYMMPEKTGESFINSVNSENINIPILLITGTDIGIDHLKSKPNVKDVLTKPINYNQFNVLVKTHILK